MEEKYKVHIPSKEVGDMFKPDTVKNYYSFNYDNKKIEIWRAEVEVVIDNVEFIADVIFIKNGKNTYCFNEKNTWLNKGEDEGYEEIPTLINTYFYLTAFIEDFIKEKNSEIKLKRMINTLFFAIGSIDERLADKILVLGERFPEIERILAEDGINFKFYEQ